MPALIDYLEADAGVAAQVSSRIFGVTLPETEVPNMPRKAIVLQEAGGPSYADNLRRDTVRIDGICYGATELEAKEVRGALFDAMRALDRSVQAGTLLHSAVRSAGPVDLRFPTTEWPAQIESWLVSYGTVIVA